MTHLVLKAAQSSNYSVAEARILYEIYGNERISATDIVSSLHVDKGYLSRILKKFEANGLVIRQTSKTDLRKATISLTDAGRKLAEKLIAESNKEIEKDLSGISEERLKELSGHMEAIHIYEKYGFHEIKLDNYEYVRGDIAFERWL